MIVLDNEIQHVETSHARENAWIDGVEAIIIESARQPECGRGIDQSKLNRPLSRDRVAFVDQTSVPAVKSMYSTHVLRKASLCQSLILI